MAGPIFSDSALASADVSGLGECLEAGEWGGGRGGLNTRQLTMGPGLVRVRLPGGGCDVRTQ